MKQTTEKKPRYSKPVRLLALVMSLLVTGGILTYIGWFIVDLFS